MAQPTSFPENNWQHGDTPCFIDDAQVITCWQLTPEEVAEVVRTGKVWLGIVGIATPPAWIQGTPPFTEEQPITGILGSSLP